MREYYKVLQGGLIEFGELEGIRQKVNFQLILVDNAVDRQAARGPRVRWHRKEDHLLWVPRDIT